MRERKKQTTRRMKKRQVLRPSISVRPIADWFRGAWVAVKREKRKTGKLDFAF